MTTLAELIERVKRWPTQRQEDVARVIERMEQSGAGVYHLTEDERQLIDEGLKTSVVREEEMDRFWNRHQV